MAKTTSGVASTSGKNARVGDLQKGSGRNVAITLIIGGRKWVDRQSGNSQKKVVGAKGIEKMQDGPKMRSW